MPRLTSEQTSLQHEAIVLLVKAVYLADSPEPDDFEVARLCMELAERMVQRLKGTGDERGKELDWRSLERTRARF